MGSFVKRYTMPLTFLGLFAAVWMVQASSCRRTPGTRWSPGPAPTCPTSRSTRSGRWSLRRSSPRGAGRAAGRRGDRAVPPHPAVREPAGRGARRRLARPRHPRQPGRRARAAGGSLLSDSIRTVPDVGPSYVLCAALVAAFLYGRGRVRRLLALAGWCALVPVLLDGLLALKVAAVGHLTAMLAGALIGGLLLLLERRRVWCPRRPKWRGRGRSRGLTSVSPAPAPGRGWRWGSGSASRSPRRAVSTGCPSAAWHGVDPSSGGVAGSEEGGGVVVGEWSATPPAGWTASPAATACPSPASRPATAFPSGTSRAAPGPDRRRGAARGCGGSS